jgi:hypothetical protein
MSTQKKVATSIGNYKPGDVVHLMTNGQASCGFSMEISSKWPPGNGWTYYPDAEHITCPDCKEQAMRMS